MSNIVIDCTHVTSPRALHLCIARELNLPQWYGGNLDALHDCLTSIREDTLLTFTGFSALGTFSNGFRRVLTAAEQENPHLFVELR